MAVVNQYKFAGLNANTDNTEKNPFGSGNPEPKFAIESLNGISQFFLNLAN